PQVTYGGNFNWGLFTFDLDVSGTLDVELTVQANLQASGRYEPDPIALLAKPIPLVIVGGFIGPVPVVVDATLEMNLGLEAQAEGEGTLTAGFTSQQTIGFGSNLRSGQWTNYKNRTSSSDWTRPGWQITG